MNQKKKTIEEIIVLVLEYLKELNYSEGTIKKYRSCYNGLQRYMEEIGEEYYTAETGLDYICQKYEIKIEELCGKQPRGIRITIRTLQVLWDYCEYGSMVTTRKRGYKEHDAPIQFAEEYNAFFEECIIRNYTPSGKNTLLSAIRKFLNFMNDLGLSSSKMINIEQINKFLASYSGRNTSTISTVISYIRSYLNFIRDNGYIHDDLAAKLPKIKISRNAILPSSWKQEDVCKMLNTIDRNNPEGKRDYTILLIVTRLGLRVSDIRTLKLSSINWVRKEISIVMQKTKQPLTLPLFDDIGWAIIDYLKNGRPNTISEFIFIKHIVPYDGFSDSNCFNVMIGKRMNKAGLRRSKKQGMHSLRNTLARVMLENEAPLPVIAEVLGHQNIQTTKHYLHIDVEGLKRCALDPEEVTP